MKDFIEGDLPEALAVLKDIKKSSRECLQHIRGLVLKLQERSSNVSSQGISFLDVKNQLMGNYMANLGVLMDKKTSGQSVKDDPCVDRLVEIRTVLEKMRPIEHKLKYQMNKVVAAYKAGQLDPNDPRKFKANFGAFANVPNANSSDEEDEAATEENVDKKSKTYVVPKLTPVYYSDDETTEERNKKMQQKTTKRALSSAMLKEMREQFTDAPVEILESQDLHRFRDNRKQQERVEYEENNFVRLSVSKKESAGMKKIGTVSALGAIADFGDFSAFDEGGEGGQSKKQKKQTMKKHKGKKHFGRKKHRR